MKLRWQAFTRRLRYRLALLFVRGMDGAIVSRGAYELALDMLAKLAEWADAAGLQRRAVLAHESHIENITRILVIAGELGDPSLQLTGLQERYVNIRLRSMSKRKRERLQYEAALHTLEARLGQPDVRPVASAGDKSLPPSLKKINVDSALLQG